MEFGSIIQYLQNRTILVTGGTGFLAKVFVEKILRVQPNVKKLYLLLRAEDTKSGFQRFQSEVVIKDLFRVLKEKWGANLNTLISQKVTIVPGDIGCENLGIKDSNLVEEICRELDVVVNLAAATNFDERYDVALAVNTVGALHVLNFSKKCVQLKVLLHVSTAYVCGEKEGLILEKAYRMGETLNGTAGLDVDAEIKLVEERLNELRADNVSKQYITSAMKDLGIQRARKYGWPNTYVFTKAMGEMLVGQHFSENMPIVIIRPTIVTSTYKEPFPGWVEGFRTIDSLAFGYGKGKIKCFLGDTEAVIDVIPADMVVNHMIVAMVAHSNQPAMNIYQVGSSVANPMTFTHLQDYGFHYFTKNPWINKEGKPIIVDQITVWSTMDSFNRYMTIRYLLPLKGLQIVNTAFCQYFHNIYLELHRKINFVLRLVELYKPYLFFKGIFDDMNTEKLRRAMGENNIETDVFYFDTKCINWEDYFINTHIPGAEKYVFKC